MTGFDIHEAVSRYRERVAGLQKAVVKPVLQLTTESLYVTQGGRFAWMDLREVRTDWVFRNVRVDLEKLEVDWPQPDQPEGGRSETARELFKANPVVPKAVFNRTGSRWASGVVAALVSPTLPRFPNRDLIWPKVEVDWLVKPKDEAASLKLKWRARLRLTWGYGESRLIFSVDDCMVFDQEIPAEGYTVRTYGVGGDDWTFLPGETFYRVQLSLHGPTKRRIIEPGNGIGAFMIQANRAVKDHLEAGRTVYAYEKPGKMEERLKSSLDSRQVKEERAASRLVARHGRDLARYQDQLERVVIRIEQARKTGAEKYEQLLEKGAPQKAIDALVETTRVRDRELRKKKVGLEALIESRKVALLAASE